MRDRGPVRPGTARRDRRLIAAAVGLRVIVAAVLVAGPWTDQAAELAGWDVDRFHEIAHAPGRAYVDHAVEYPPVSVALIELVASGGLVAAHRLVVIVALAADLATAALVGRRGGVAAARRHLVLGSALLAVALLRFDTVSALLAVGARLALAGRRAVGFAVLATGGFLVKSWPALVVAIAAVRRWWRGVVAGATAVAASLAVWVAIAGVDGIRQVSGFRGADGWHIGSGPGVVVHLLSGLPGAALESGAFRFGSAPTWAATASIGAVAAAWLVVDRRRDQLGDDEAMVALVGTLVVTAPLFSPQYAVWLTPFLALAWPHLDDRARILGALTIVSTGAMAAIVHPADVDGLVPQLVLLGRNAALAGLVVTTLWGRGRGDRRAVDSRPTAATTSPAA